MLQSTGIIALFQVTGNCDIPGYRLAGGPFTVYRTAGFPVLQLLFLAFTVYSFRKCSNTVYEIKYNPPSIKVGLDFGLVWIVDQGHKSRSNAKNGVLRARSGLRSFIKVNGQGQISGAKVDIGGWTLPSAAKSNNPHYQS